MRHLKKINDELRTVETGIQTTINKNDLTIFLASIRNKKPNLSSLTDEQILALTGIYKNNELTFAGLMLFGLYPQAMFPQLFITAVVVPGYEIGSLGEDEERFIRKKG